MIFGSPRHSHLSSAKFWLTVTVTAGAYRRPLLIPCWNKLPLGKISDPKKYFHASKARFKSKITKFCLIRITTSVGDRGVMNKCHDDDDDDDDDDGYNDDVE